MDADYALVPVKGLWTGKSRLAEALSPAERHALNALQLSDTLAAVTAVFGARRCVVVTGCQEATRVAEHAGVICLREPSPGSLNSALAHGRRWLRRQGARMLTVVPVDLPYLSEQSLAEVLARRDRGDAFIVPDRALAGTNLLHVPARAPLAFRYGAGSYAKHARMLRECGVHPGIYLDTPLSDDLDLTVQLFEWAHRDRPTTNPHLG